MKTWTAFLCCLAVSLPLSAKSLYWRSLDVQARLEKSGQLRIQERHTMVFDGDWNGGERAFRVAPGQELALVSLSRIDPRTGAEQPLRQGGSPPDLHEYAWAGSSLRWRIRRPSDPPLRAAELTYVLVYTLRNALARDGDHYRLDHDFAFESRTGPIEKYTLRIEVDPAWEAAPDAPLRMERNAIPPGETVAVSFRLAYLGEGSPQFIASPMPVVRPHVVPTAPPPPPPPPPAWLVPAKVVLAALFVLASWMAVRFFQARERQAGRYDPAPQVDRRWLETNLFTQRPEVVGAAWDSTTGEAEVAALIALMTLEGKIEQIGAGRSPQLRLLVPRQSLSDYERAFVEKLFIKGDTIDRDTLRKHYASTGFDPAATLRVPLAHAAAAAAGSTPLGAPLLAGCAAFFIVPVIISTLAGIAGDDMSALLVVPAGLVLFVSVAVGAWYRKQLKGPAQVRLIAVPSVVLTLLGILVSGVVMTVAYCAIGFAMLVASLMFSRWHGTPEQLRNRRNFLAARAYFAEMLARTDAMIEDHWIPYVLAFGLSSELDRWSVAAPVAEQSSIRRGFTPAARSSSGGGGSTAPQFAGGGGGFGGGGATGGWASGIASFAASVPAPASSSSGSSGSWSGGSSGSRSSSSSGGSRSGGGGGGGW